MPILVNDEYVDDALIRGEAESVRREMSEDNPGQDTLALEMRAWEYARENVIGRILLKQAALAGTASTPAHELEANACTEQFVAQLTAAVPRPKSSEVLNYYRKHRDRFHHPEVVHASHIVKNVDENTNEATARARMEEVLRSLQGGMPFAEAADQFSDCPGRGGDLGFFARGQMVDEFEAVVFGLKKGAVSGIFRTPFGFHIAKLHEKIPEGIWPLEKVREQIENGILNARKSEIVAQFVAGLRETAKIRRVSSQHEARV